MSPEQSDLGSTDDALGGDSSFISIDVKPQATQNDEQPSQATSVVQRSTSVTNFSRVLRGRAHITNIKTPRRSQSSAHMRTATEVKRWDPRIQSASPWDGLKHDEELWYEDGDCNVHLYGRGRSQRGPSFKIYSGDLEAANWAPMDTVRPAFAKRRYNSERFRSDTKHASICENPTGGLEIFVAAPEDTVRNETFQWHLTTRNFFAWLTHKPLVGITLGKALIDLLGRMRLFRPQADNISDLLSYAERLGYQDFVHCPDNALAFLRFAEHYKLSDLWVDAFAHCVGMNDRLYLSTEFTALSRVTKALITRASLEMELHLGRVSRALKTFLENELSPANFGLPAGAQDHLDRFRSFLHTFYVNQFGYWPPEQDLNFSKTRLRSMYTEFHALYDILVDRDSSDSVQSQTKSASGGICVLQNLGLFNQRHNYEPLDHPLPLIPAHQTSTRRTQSQKGLRAFKLGARSKFEEDMTMRTALVMATNSVPDALEHALVRDYISFEREWSVKHEEKLSVADGRKVRWIVIYSILQMLISVTRAPREVKNSFDASYHMCILTEGTPPWRTKMSITPKLGDEHDSHTQSYFGAGEFDFGLEIRPDCEADGYMLKRFKSNSSLRPAPLRVNTTGITRMDSFRSFRQQVKSNMPKPLVRSVTSVSPTTTRRTDPRVSVHDFGNGLSSTSMQRLDNLKSSLENATRAPQQIYRPLQASEHDTTAVKVRTPTVDTFAFDSPMTSSSPSSSRLQSAYSPISSVESSPWQIDDTDALSWTGKDDDRRLSRGIYNMDHESEYSIGSASAPMPKLDFASPSSAAAYYSSSAAFSDADSYSSSSNSPSRPSSPPSPPPPPAAVRSRPSASGFFSLLSGKKTTTHVAAAADVYAPPARDVVEMPSDYCDNFPLYHHHTRGDEFMPDVDVQIDIHRALDLLPLHIPAQAL